MKLHYMPEGAYLTTPNPFLYKNRLHILCSKYLNNFFAENESEGLVILITEDGIHFEECSLGIQAPSGTIVDYENRFHLFYTGRNEICHATSTSINGPWINLSSPIRPDLQIYKGSAWKDPWVWRDTSGIWHMILGAEIQNSTGRSGCIAHCISYNLYDWNVCHPFYFPGNLIIPPSTPCFFRIGSEEYLFYTVRSDNMRLHYRYRVQNCERWIIPYKDTLDTRGFAYGRIIRINSELLLWGIIPTRNQDKWNFRPEKYSGQDFNSWDIGGSLQCHILTQADDLSLQLSPPPISILCRPNSLYWEALNGCWEISDSSYKINAENFYAKLISKNNVPDVCWLSLDIDCDSSLQRAALVVHVNEDFSEGYYFYLEPFLKRVQFRSAYRMTDQGSWAFPHEVELEVFIPNADNHFHLDLFIDHGIMILYINKSDAMSIRLRDYTGCHFGLAAAFGSVCFSNMKLYTLERPISYKETL